MLESEQTLNSSLNYNENPISTDIDDQVLEIEVINFFFFNIG